MVQLILITYADDTTAVAKSKTNEEEKKSVCEIMTQLRYWLRLIG